MIPYKGTSSATFKDEWVAVTQKGKELPWRSAKPNPGAPEAVKCRPFEHLTMVGVGDFDESGRTLSQTLTIENGHAILSNNFMHVGTGRYDP